MTLLEQCQLWHEQDRHQQIADTLEAIPEEERTPELDLELARAYNNLADPETPEGRELLRQAIALMAPHRDRLADDYSWNFRMGYAYYYLDQEGPALGHFERALELHPGDDPKYNTAEDIQYFINDCRQRLTLPQFKRPFRQRTAEAWAAFSQGEARLRRMMDEDRAHKRGAELIAACSQMLNRAFEDLSFELGFNGEKYELILTPEGDRVKLFELFYFQRRAPREVLEHWNILVGRRPNESAGLQMAGWDISGNDVQVWTEQLGENSIGLAVYCQPLLPLLREDEDRAWWMLATLTDQVLGEIPHMRYIDRFEVLEAPKEGPAILLSQLPGHLKDLGLDLSPDPEAYLECFTAYQMEPEEDPEADWRLDVFAGSTRCPPLLNGYLQGDSGAADALHQDGAAAGFLLYPLDGFTGEERSGAILDFRDALAAALEETAGADAFTFLGGATGIHCGYLDFLAWDLDAVLQAAAGFFRDSPVPWASFHSFRRDAGTVSLKRPPARADGPILTPEDVTALEGMCEGPSGYFYKMLSYLEERIRAGVREDRFTWEQARADLDVALWYSYACNNVDEYEFYYRAADWMPDSEEAAAEAGSGIWYYRYACALLYCGRLEEALDYARKGVELEPGYVWGWLQYAKLLSHFGDREGALAAADQGLALAPGDYEFTTLRREILEGRNLEEMEFHWIDPECDRRLQEGLDEGEADKRRAISHILCDRDNLAAIRAALAPAEWEADSPYCTFTIPYQDRSLEGRFFGNEAALSKLPAPWFRELVRRLPELERRGRTFLSARAGLGTDGLQLERFTVSLDRQVGLIYQRGDTQVVRFDADFSLSQDQLALERPEGGSFLAFVLLEQPAWDEEQFRRDLRDEWAIPCLTQAEEGEDGASALVFEPEGMLAAVSLMPFPVPHGEAEENAGRNYLWTEAEETARRHRGQLLVSVQARGRDPGQAGRLLVKLVCAASRQPGVLGICANGTVYQPEFYQAAAEMMEDGSLPLLDLVWLGLYRREGGLCAYTEGMRAFGKDEMEVLDTDAQPGDLRGFLLDIADYVLDNDVTLHDGETIGFSDGQRLAITRSAGVWHQGMTLKIEYAPMPEED